MTKKEKVTIILELLHEHYGPTKCYLDHENAWQLLDFYILKKSVHNDFHKSGHHKTVYCKFRPLLLWQSADP